MLADPRPEKSFIIDNDSCSHQLEAALFHIHSFEERKPTGSFFWWKSLNFYVKICLVPGWFPRENSDTIVRLIHWCIRLSEYQFMWSIRKTFSIIWQQLCFAFIYIYKTRLYICTKIPEHPLPVLSFSPDSNTDTTMKKLVINRRLPLLMII